MNQIPIATRQPPGDKWLLIDYLQDPIETSLTLALNSYYKKTGYRGSYILDPLGGTISIPVEETPRPEPTYDIYGES